MAYLNQRGYVIIKKLNLPEPLEKIRKDLPFLYALHNNLFDYKRNIFRRNSNSKNIEKYFIIFCLKLANV